MDSIWTPPGNLDKCNLLIMRHLPDREVNLDTQEVTDSSSVKPTTPKSLNLNRLSGMSDAHDDGC